MVCPECKKSIDGHGAILSARGWKCEACGHSLKHYITEPTSDNNADKRSHSVRVSPNEQNRPSNVSLLWGIGLFVFGLAIVLNMHHLAQQSKLNEVVSEAGPTSKGIRNVTASQDSLPQKNKYRPTSQDARVSGVIPGNDTRRVITQTQSEVNQHLNVAQDGTSSPRIYAPYNVRPTGNNVLDLLSREAASDGSSESRFREVCGTQEGCVFIRLTKPGAAHVASGWVSGDIARLDIEGHRIAIERDGRFTEPILILGLPGLNKYQVQATDKSGNTTTANIYLTLKGKTNVNPFEELEGQIEELSDRIEDLER